MDDMSRLVSFERKPEFVFSIADDRYVDYLSNISPRKLQIQLFFFTECEICNIKSGLFWQTRNPLLPHLILPELLETMSYRVIDMYLARKTQNYNNRKEITNLQAFRCVDETQVEAICIPSNHTILISLVTSEEEWSSDPLLSGLALRTVHTCSGLALSVGIRRWRISRHENEKFYKDWLIDNDCINCHNKALWRKSV